MRNARRLLAALLAVVMLIPSILVPGYAAETTGFKDVREDSWYANAVDYVSAAGYMKGTSKDAFSPGEDVTRAMFVTILSRVARAQTDNTVSAFGDVAANQYYSGAIEWAAEKEIVNGVGGGLFAPYRSITRQDLAVMLCRFVNAMGCELSAGESRTYTDEAAISAYAADAVRFVTSTGLFAGYQDGSFRPKATATRAQTAVIVMRLAQLLDGQIVDPEPMPAQSFDQTSEQMQVSVNAPEGALPENTRMTVSRVTDEAALAELASKVGAKVLGAADISFAKDGAELEPARKVSVRISLDALQSAKNPAVVHVKDDGSFEYVSSSVVTTRGKADAIEFEADSFSVYAVLDANTNATLTISFYARLNGSEGDWQIVNKQIIRADQLGAGKSAIADPGVPNITTSQAFEGWMIEAENAAFNPSFTFDADTAKYSVRQINDYCNETPLTVNKEVVLYAAVYDVIYITYHDQAGAVIHAEYEKLSGGYSDKLINVPYNPFKASQHWAGWVPASHWIQAGDVNGTMPTYAAGADEVKWTDGCFQRLTASVDLYPYLEEGFWLYFDSNESANNTKNGFDDSTSAGYTPPVFVAHGKNTAAPAQPNRAGYTFEGWYTDKDMTTPFTFGSPLNEETVVYAKWTPAAASYTVVFMVQKATDPNDNDVSNNTYSFYDAVSRDWTWNSGKQSAKSCDEVSAFTASSVTQNDAYLGTGALSNTTYYPSTVAALGQYFNYSAKNTGNTVKVKGDGSTVLYVYYDRKPVTLNFYEGSFSSANADTKYYDGSYYYYYTECQYFGKISGNHVPLTLVYDSSYTSFQGSAIYTGYASFKVTSTGAAYTGTVYAYVRGTASNNLVASITGLYGADISETDKWFKVSDPYVYCYESGTDASGNQKYTMKENISEYVPGVGYSGNAFTINYYLQSKFVSTSEKTLHQMSQNPETGEWGVEYVTSTVTNTTGMVIGNSVGRRFIGYNLSGDSMGSGFVSLDGNTPYTFRYENIIGNDAYAYKELLNYDLIFMSSTGEVRRETLRYQQKTAKYQYKRIDENTLSTTDLYVPADGPAGYYFDGWYTDSAYQTEFKFTGKMPDRNVTLYAKWSPIRFRVVCDPTDNGTNTDVSFSGNQTTMFVLNYDEKVDSIGLNSARSEGKILLGWFLDPECTKPFSLETHLTTNTEGMDMTYAESTSRTWTDTWDGGKTVTDPKNVRGILRLYAKWRVDPEGVVGIKVRYLGDHAENDKGYFETSGMPHTVTMDEVYTDQALAAAHSATVPAMPDADTQDGSRRFLYWEILDKFGNPTGEIVYPGAPFTIDINKAVEIKTPLPDPNCTHMENGEPCIVAVEATAPTCTEPGTAAHYKCTRCGRPFSDAAGSNETTLANLKIAALGHAWGTPTYEWNPSNFGEDTVPTCTATVVCGRDDSHVETETVEAALIVSGTEGHYEAEFENPLFEKQLSDEFQVSRLVVTYLANGQTLVDLTETVAAGSTVTLPAADAVPAVSGYTFVGWVTDDVSETAAAPTALTGSYTVTANVTLKALYSREVTTGGTYTRLTSAPGNWAGNYVITYRNDNSLYALKGLSGNKYYEGLENGGTTPYAATGMTRSGNTLTNVSPYYVFTMAKSGDYYTIQNSETGTYVSRYATSDTAELVSLTSDFPNYSTFNQWSPAFEGTNGNVKLNNINTESGYYSGYKYLGFGGEYFWADGPNGNSAQIYLWKETTAPGSEIRYTTAPAALGSVTVSFTVPSSVTAVESLTAASGSGVVLPAAEAPSGYYFVGWRQGTLAETETAPTDYLASGAYYVPNANVTLTAVYFYNKLIDVYDLLTSVPGIIPGYYVLSSGNTTSGYMLKSCAASGTSLESTTYVTQMSTTNVTIHSQTSSGTTYYWLTNVNATNRFIFYSVNNYDGYYSIRNNDGLCVALDGGYLKALSSLTAYGLWEVSASNSQFLFTNYSSSSSYRYLRYNSGYFAATNSTTPNIYLWKQRTAPSYTTTRSASASSVSMVEPMRIGAGGVHTASLPDADKAAVSDPASANSPALTSGKTGSEARLTNLSANANAIPNPNPLGTDDVWVPTTTIDTSKEYLIGISDGTNVYLLANRSGSNYYYTLDSIYRYLYTGTATLDGNNVIGVTGAQTSLDNCKWKFGSSTGGVITNQYNTNYKLDSGTSGASDGTTTFYQLYQSSYGASSTYNSSSNTLKIGSRYLGLVSTGNADYGCVLDSQPTTSVILYTKATNYTVSYNANASDATGTMADQTLTAGLGTLTANAFTRSGYTFAGWNTAADGTGAAASDSAKVMVTANLTLYAQWVKTPGFGETVTYELATTLTAGEDYVVVIGSYAVGNTTVTDGHYLNAQSVTVNSNNTITVPANAASSVLWHATGSTSGWFFYNPSANGFIGLDSHYYLAVESHVGRAWTYDGTDLNNNCRDTGNAAYYYLSCNTANAYFTTSTSPRQYVKFYKRVITAATYTVTVNPTENGTVRANYATATAGETVRLRLTPADGYMVDTVTVTTSDGTEVAVSGASGRYSFTMPAANVTVTVTFKPEAAENAWIVSFRDEEGNAIPGMNDVYVPMDSPTLNESDLPDPAKEEHYFLGWYQGNDKCTFPKTVNSDIVLTPKYSPMYAYDYTLTLRAVYGPYNPDATTHIYWYANNGTEDYNGAGERFVSTVTESGLTTDRLPFNAQVDIPYPTGSGSQLVFAGDNGGTLVWEDHVFLGWARVDNGGSSYYAEAKALTADDLYLKWDGSKYLVKNDSGEFVEFNSQKVYADETTPYHDMYAVWAGFYYIYHSSDGSLEAVQVPFDARETKNLVAEVKTNYLYGGYYTGTGAVAAVTAEQMRTAKNAVINAADFWNYATGTAKADASTSLLDAGAVVYNGESIKHTVAGSTVQFWNKAQAYGFGAQADAPSGDQMTPVAGAVYYLKEVPKTFLPNKLVYVKADKNTQLYDGTPIEEGKLTSLYLLTAVDDRNYSANGFMVGTAHSGQNVSTLDANSGPADTVSRVFTIFVKNGATYSYNAHELNPSIGVPQGMNPNLVGFVAAKHLDYDWIQAHKGQTDGVATFYLKPYWTTLDGVTVTQDTIKGVNITADGKDISFVNVQ